MKIFYKNSYKLVKSDNYYYCSECPFFCTKLCYLFDSSWDCRYHRLILDKTQIFNL